MEKLQEEVNNSIKNELGRANNQHFPKFHSLHEGASIIYEELQEAIEALEECKKIYDRIWSSTRRDIVAVDDAARLIGHARLAACECIQLATMGQKYLDSFWVAKE